MSARKPVLIVRESLAASPAFHSTLSATHTLRIAKDAAFIPDIIATPANGCEQPLSFVWLDGAAAFSTPEGISEAVTWVTKLVNGAKNPHVLLGLPLANPDGFAQFQMRLFEESTAGSIALSPNLIPVLGLGQLASTIEALQRQAASKQKDKICAHTAAMRLASTTPASVLAFATAAIPCSRVMEDFKYALASADKHVVLTGSLAQLAEAEPERLTAQTPLLASEAKALRDFFDTESELLE